MNANRWTVAVHELSPHTARVAFLPPGSDPPGPTFAVQQPPTPRTVPVQDRWAELCGGKLRVFVADDGRPPTADNFRIEWRCAGQWRRWRPGELDHDNLGTAFLSLDNLWRDYVPTGVHPYDPCRPFDDYVSNIAMLTHVIEDAYLRRHGQPLDWRRRNEEVKRLLRGQPPELFDRWPEMAHRARATVAHSPPGLLSRSGLAIIRDGTRPWDPQRRWIEPQPAEPPAVFYLVYHACDWHLALRELTGLFGPPPALPPFLLGVWYSNYSRLGAADFRRLADQFAGHGLPLDALSIDMDWHGRHWHGYRWNRELFPDPSAFARWLHDQNLRAALNVHPLYVPADEPGVPEFVRRSGHSGRPMPPDPAWQASCIDPLLEIDIYDQAQALSYMEVFHTPAERSGCNFWWVDGWLRLPNYRGECSWLNHVYRQHLLTQPQCTPIVLSRAGGLGAHRDPILFTGDACSQWEVLAFEVETSIRAAGGLMAYVSHDIGGFFHDPADHPTNQPPDELFVRWVQFGCLSSTMRFHSFAGVREPWRFAPATLDICRRFMLLRMRLVPYLHELVEAATTTGLPLVRPMWFEFSETDAYHCLGQYMLGPHLLVAPVTQPQGHVRFWLPPGRWHDVLTDRTLRGPAWIQQQVPLDQMPLLLRDGASFELGRPALRADQVMAGPRETPRSGKWI